jgi:alginate O-acetyltransferase complex protein AlgI
MLYSNVEFIILFSIVLLVYCAFEHHREWKFWLLTVASVFFYAWAGLGNFLVFMCVVFVSWFVVWMAERSLDHRIKKRWVVGGVLIMTLHLFFWKYASWVYLSIQNQFPYFLREHTFSLPLPIGISFFTLQGIAYIVDYGRGQVKCMSFKQVFLAKSFFPQLVAGPIVRMQQISPQLSVLPQVTWNDLREGLLLFVLGLFKKLAIADRMAMTVDPVFANPTNYSGSAILFATVAYTVQIWADFSGYTDMGRGAARMLGIRLPENFLSPYLAKSPSEFWRRWHITLSQWIRDYVYVPMGGAKGSLFRISFVLVLTMAISGLWHGAALTFVIWGLYHGALLILERVSKTIGLPLFKTRFGIVLMFALTVLGWLIFRASSIDDCLLMLSILAGNAHVYAMNVRGEPVLGGLICCFVLQAASYRSLDTESTTLWQRKLASLEGKNPVVVSALLGLGAAFFIVGTLLLRVGTGSVPFIYFQF